MPPYSKTTWVDGSLPAIDASKLNKMEQGIFDSLRQDGSTTMSGQLVTTAGSAATPAIAPTGDANTGIFFPAADTIAFGEGGTEAMRIDSSGNIGIGKTSLSHRLEVSNSSAGETFVRFENSNTIANVSSSILLTTNTNSGSAISSVIQSLAENATGSTALIFRTASSGAGSEKMRITSAGNVGIGTTAPNVSGLEISRATGSATPTPVELRLSTTTNASDWSTTDPWGRISFYSSDVSAGGAKIQASIDTVSQGTTGGVSSLRLNVTDGQATPSLVNGMTILSIASSNPYVGIGTTLPSAELHVKGTGEIARIETTTARGSGQGYIQFNDPTGAKGYVGYTQSSDDNFNINNALSADIVLRTNNTERMRIISTGNVGIGTTSPSAELHVKGSSETVRIETTTARGGGNTYLTFYDPDGLKSIVGHSTTNDEFRIINNLNANMQLYTNSTARLMIEAGGTTRPSSNNTYDLGSSSYRWATIYAQNALNTSDARLKTDVAPSSLGLDFINQLNPVQYRWIEGGNTVEKVQTGTETVEITPAIPAQSEVLDEEGNVIQEATEEVPAVTEERPVYETVVKPREGVRTHFGLIAQEVKAALPDGLDFAGWCLADKDDADSTQSLGYTQLIAPMIKAIQELKGEVDALKAQLNK